VGSAERRYATPAVTATQLSPPVVVGAALIPDENDRTRGRGRRLLVHVVVYAMALLAFMPFMRVNTGWSVDEGLYVYQVRALQQGDWNLNYWASSIDPDGRWFPLNRNEQHGDSYYPFIKSPAYPALMYGATRLLGEAVGLHILPLAGALLTAVAAWLLASLVDRRAAPYAFWLAALGPVVVNAYAVWAHALSAGVAGLTAYVAIRAVQDRLSARWLLSLVVGAAGGVLLRSEGLLFAAALAAVFVTVGAIRFARRYPRALTAVVLAGVIGIAALGANRLEGRWIGSFSGQVTAKSDYVSGGDTPYLAGKIEGATHVLAGVNYFEGREEPLTDAKMLLTMVATLLAGVALARRSRRAGNVAIAALGVVILLLGLRFLGPPDTAPGVIAAWPVAIVGLLLFKWRAATVIERLLLGIVALEVLATLATQYPEGGAIEWGARYLSPLYPLIAALAALSLYRTVRETASDARWRMVRPALIGLAVFAAGAGLYGQAGVRMALDQSLDRIASASGPVITSDEWFAQVGYRTYPDHEWLHVAELEIPTALTKLADAGYKDVILFEPLDKLTDDPSRIPGGYEVRRDLRNVLYLTHP
jgi:hypothetical protein